MNEATHSRKLGDLFSRREAARYLGVSETTLAIWASVGRYDLPYVRIGRLVKYRLDDLEAFVQRNVVVRKSGTDAAGGL